MPECFIIDDESYAIELLSDYVLQTPGLKLAGTSQNPVAGLHSVLEIKPDIVFLDVDMPKLSGLELICLLDDRFSVVLTTAHSSYAVEAFNLNAVDFLLKPIGYNRFLRCIEKLSKKGNSSTELLPPIINDFIFLQSGVKGKMIKISFEDIRYVESFNNYIMLHLPNENHTIYMSLKEVMAQLPENRFFRIHKSFIVNYQYIKAIDGSRVFLNSAIELPVGSQYREEFLKLISGATRKRK